MAYDHEKYREKREKVLGVKKRGVSFGTLAAIVSVIILLGTGLVVIPKSVAYFNTRHLDDAVFKVAEEEGWPDNVLGEIFTLQGVKNVLADKKGARIVITFDRTVMELPRLVAFLKQKGLQAVLLNRVGHRQRMSTLKKEARFEAL